ncbi:SurA N-terminal domain-containing protein [Acidobacteriota bacterium]
MRQNVKSLAPVLWFVIAAFIITIFATWGGGGEIGGKRASNTLATVGREKISASLYYGKLQQQLESMKEQFSELDTQFIQQLNIPQQVLEQLIQQTLLLQASNELGIKATNKEVVEKIKNYPVFQNEGNFIGFEEYRNILEWNRINLSEFEEGLKKEIRIEKTVKFITSGVTLSPNNLWEAYKNNNETAKIEYIVSETAKIEMEAEFTPEELKTFYERKKEEYKIPERREADYVFFVTDDVKAEMELTESEIAKYYQDNLTQFQDPEKIKVSRIFLPLEDKEMDSVKTEAQEILDRINSGEDFVSLAKIYSKDDKAIDGGDWGLFDWRSLSAAEQDEIAGLAAEAVSNPIELADGISILKVTQKDPANQQPLEAVTERITTLLRDEKAREFVDGKAVRLEKAARKEKSLNLAAQKLGLQILSSGPLKEGDSIEDIDPSGSISFSLFQLEQDSISTPIFTYKGVGIAQLKKVEAPRPAEFEEVEEEVKENLLEIRKNEKALEAIKNAQAAFGRIDFVKLAEEFNLEYKTVEEHKRSQYIGLVGNNEEIDNLAFSLPLEQVSDPIAFADGYTLVRVLDRKTVTKEDLEANKDTERETILESEKNRFITSYLTNKREKKGVNIKYDLFFQINTEVISKYVKN